MAAASAEIAAEMTTADARARQECDGAEFLAPVGPGDELTLVCSARRRERLHGDLRRPDLPRREAVLLCRPGGLFCRRVDASSSPAWRSTRRSATRSTGSSTRCSPAGRRSSAGRRFDTSRIYARSAATCRDYDIDAQAGAPSSRACPPTCIKRLRQLSTRVAVVDAAVDAAAADAWLDAGLVRSRRSTRRGWPSSSPATTSTQVTSPSNRLRVRRASRTSSTACFALHGLDTDHAGCVSEVLQARGPIYTVGAACASGNMALRCAVDEIRHHDLDAVVVVGAVLEFAPIDLHAMALMGAITFESFNDEPAAREPALRHPRAKASCRRTAAARWCSRSSTPRRRARRADLRRGARRRGELRRQPPAAAVARTARRG